MFMLGREKRMPGEVSIVAKPLKDSTQYGHYVIDSRNQLQKSHCIAREHLKVSTLRQMDCHDGKLPYDKYKPGNYVWYMNKARQEGVSPKLQSLYEGPYRITETLSEVDYRVQKSKKDKSRVVHYNRLKPYEGNIKFNWAKNLARRN